MWIRQRRTLNKHFPFLFIGPSVLGVSLFTFIPFLDVLKRSLLSPMGDQFVGIENYKEVWMEDLFQLAVRNTFKFLVICIPVLMCISLCFACMIFQMVKGQKFYRLIFLLPLLVPSSVLVFFLKMFLPAHCMEQNSSFLVLAGIYLWKNIGYDLMLFFVGLCTIPKELHEAAMLDGCNRWQHFIYITLPLLRNTKNIVLIFSVIYAFHTFREIYLLAGEYPQKKIFMFQQLMNHWFLNLDISNMCVASVLFVVFLGFVMFLYACKERRIHG